MQKNIRKKWPFLPDVKSLACLDAISIDHKIITN